MGEGFLGVSRALPQPPSLQHPAMMVIMDDMSAFAGIEECGSITETGGENLLHMYVFKGRAQTTRSREGTAAGP